MTKRIPMAALLITVAFAGCDCGDDDDDVGDGGLGDASLDGASGGDGDNGGDGDGPRGPVGVGPDGGDLCEIIERGAEGVPPEVVILQDLSSSLIGEWQPLDDAMTQVASTFSTRMELGLVPFPTTYFKGDMDADRVDSNCDIGDGQVISPAIDQGDDVVAVYDAIVEDDMIGGTPTNAALDVARDLVLPRGPDDQAVPYFILVTDGEPNCMFTQNPGSQSSQMAQDAVTDRITALEGDGVDTYVVGYNFSGGILDTWAAAGGTDSAFEADNASQLVDALEAIAKGIAPCVYTLDSAVADPAFVRVRIDGETRLFGDDDGWSIDDDMATITLEGSACTTLRDGDDHTVEVTVECSEVGPE